ncbi:uncharacterized protein LOC107500408 isoform X2 [Rousettus aegyptiacus]|uniref:uncharacterized protein LOC107500408 isoform X2 n=1 Tax=Rousettus aegyptiacus TaxID=9407 RepID=UPI00168D2BBB|nr:uncharacterized protein LOC107500408 isoform X2 [Rousettus aegyptiacus]
MDQTRRSSPGGSIFQGRTGRGRIYHLLDAAENQQGCCSSSRKKRNRNAADLRRPFSGEEARSGGGRGEEVRPESGRRRSWREMKEEEVPGSRCCPFWGCFRLANEISN